MSEPVRLVEVARHVERRMHAQTGSVTLHYAKGKLERLEYRIFEAAEALRPRPELATATRREE